MDASRRPLLLLDVDGVLNPYPHCPEGFAEYRLFPENREPVRLSALHGAWLGEVSQMFSIAWATAWGEDANRLLCPHFGLPRFPVVVLPAAPFDPSAKVAAVDAFVGVQRPGSTI
jgi:hypothetical protein